MNTPTVTLRAGHDRPIITFDVLVDDGWFEDIFTSKRKFVVSEGPTDATRISGAVGHFAAPGYRRLDAFTWEVDRLATLLRVAVISFGEVRFVDEEAGSDQTVTAANVERIAPRGKLTKQREDRARFFNRVLDTQTATPEEVRRIDAMLRRSYEFETASLELETVDRLDRWQRRQIAKAEQEAADAKELALAEQYAQTGGDSTEAQHRAGQNLKAAAATVRRNSGGGSVAGSEAPKVDSPEVVARKAARDRAAYRLATAPRTRRAPRFTKYSDPR